MSSNQHSSGKETKTHYDQDKHDKDHSSSSSLSFAKEVSEDPKPIAGKDIELGPLHDYNDIVSHHSQGDRLSRIESSPVLSRQK